VESLLGFESFPIHTLDVFTYDRIVMGFVVDYGKQYLFVCEIIKIGKYMI